MEELVVTFRKVSIAYPKDAKNILIALQHPSFTLELLNPNITSSKEFEKVIARIADACARPSS